MGRRETEREGGREPEGDRHKRGNPRPSCLSRAQVRCACSRGLQASAREGARGRALGRARRSSSSSGAEPESEPWVGRGGVRRLPGLSPSPSPGSGVAEFGVFRGRARVRALGRARQSLSSSGAEPESEPWGRARRSFLWRPRPDLVAVSLTLSSGTAVGVTRAALSSCQAGQWSGEVTAVTSAQSTEGRVSG
jgi:hypothetical protein